jgi:hypothetical protein
MPSYTYDEPKEPEYVLLPEGEHDFTITEVYAFENSKNGNEMLPVRLVIKSGNDNVGVTDNLVFTEKAKFRIDQLLKSIGRNPAPGAAVDFNNPGWLRGMKGRCYIKHEHYNGKDYNKVAGYCFTPGKVEGKTVTGTAPATTLPPKPDDSDDIPF